MDRKSLTNDELKAEIERIDTRHKDLECQIETLRWHLGLRHDEPQQTQQTSDLLIHRPTSK